MRAYTTWLLAVLLLAACGGGPGDAPGSGVADPDPAPVPSAMSVRRLDTDVPGAALSFAPQVGIVGDQVHVAWSDRRAGGMDVHYNRSEDGGASWLSADLRLDKDGAGFATSSGARLVADGETVFVVWHDDRAGPNDIRFNRSLDGGQTWLPLDRRIDTDGLGAANSREPDVVVDGLRIFVVWRDLRDGSWGVHFNRSLDGGDTWLADDARIDGGRAGVTNAGAPRIARAGEQLCVVWADDSLGAADVHLASSPDAGASWQAPIRMSRPAGGPSSASSPQLVMEGDALLVVYTDARAGQTDIYANASADRGASWLLQDARVNQGPLGASGAEAPHVLLAGGVAHIVWEDVRGGSDDIRYSRSPDGGLTWPATDVRLDLTTDVTAFAVRPRLAVRGDEVAVCWLDDRAGVLDVLLRRSSDGGHTWDLEERRLDEDPTEGGESLDVRVEFTARGPVAVWSDTRAGQADIFANHVRDGDPSNR